MRINSKINELRLIIFFIFASSFSYSQNGLEIVYNDSVFRIRQFNSFKLINERDLKIFIQRNERWGTGGEYFKLDKPSNSLQTAYNFALDPRFSDFCNNEFTSFPIETFVMSPLREQTFIFNSKTACEDNNNDLTMFSTNGGSNINNVNMVNCAGFDIAQNDSIFYTAGSSDLSTYYFYKSTNSGQNWVVTDTLLNLKRLNKGGFIKCNPFNPSIIYTSGINNLLMSTDSGSDFFVTSYPSFSQIIFDYSNHNIYGIKSYDIYKSTDNGITWNRIYSSPNIEFTKLQVSFDNSNIIYAGTDEGIFISTNAGYNWNLFNNAFPRSKNIIGISKDSGSNSPLYACTKFGLYKVLNSFYESNTFKSHFKIGNYFEYLFTDFQNTARYAQIIEKDTILGNGLKYFKISYFDNAGNSTLKSLEYLDSVTLKWFKFDPNCPNANYYGNTLLINFKSDTGSIIPYCYGLNKVIYNTIVNNLFGDPTYLKYSVTYPYPFIWDLNYEKYIEKFGYLGYNGFGSSVSLTGAIIDGISYGEILISVKNISKVIPEKFSLLQNYPNPFNPVTKIKFDIPSSVKRQTSLVKLVVYDAIGREVTTLVNENLSAGSYEVEFNGANFSSGIYFYTLESGSFKETKQMILLK